MRLYSWLEKKEGGFWGLVVIFAAFMIQIPSFGTAQSFGIYNMYLLKYFSDASPAAVALIGSINVGVFLGSGEYNPFANRQLTAVINGCRFRLVSIPKCWSSFMYFP